MKHKIDGKLSVARHSLKLLLVKRRHVKKPAAGFFSKRIGSVLGRSTSSHRQTILPYRGAVSPPQYERKSSSTIGYRLLSALRARIPPLNESSTVNTLRDRFCISLDCAPSAKCDICRSPRQCAMFQVSFWRSARKCEAQLRGFVSPYSGMIREPPLRTLL